MFQLPYTGKYQVEIRKRPGPYTVVALDIAHFVISCATDDEKWLKYKNNLVGVNHQNSYFYFSWYKSRKILYCVTNWISGSYIFWNCWTISMNLKKIYLETLFFVIISFYDINFYNLISNQSIFNFLFLFWCK